MKISVDCQIMPVPDDWVYVNNFQDPSEPIALRLPPGKAVELKKN